jgi:hypothetical protein
MMRGPTEPSLSSKDQVHPLMPELRDAPREGRIPQWTIRLVWQVPARRFEASFAAAAGAVRAATRTFGRSPVTA